MIGQEIARIAVGCRPRSFRQHGVIPGLPVVLEALEEVRVPILEIGPLARILDDIEQELVVGNPQILPVAIAHGALRAGLVAPVKLARRAPRRPVRAGSRLSPSDG